MMKASYSFCHMNIVLPKHAVYIGTHNTDFTNMSDEHPMALLHKNMPLCLILKMNFNSVNVPTVVHGCFM